MQRYSHPHTTSIAGTEQTDLDLVATKANLITNEGQQATTAETVLAQVQKKKKTEQPIVLSLYTTSSATSERQMEEILNSADSVKTSGIVCIGGDLNFPDMNRKDQHVLQHHTQ